MPEDITAYRKSFGQIGHRIVSDGRDLVVIDEWPDADTFGEPEVTFLEALDVPGTF